LLGRSDADATHRAAAPEPLASAIAGAFKARADEFCTKEQVAEFLTNFAARVKSEKFLSDLKESYRLVAETSDRYDGIQKLAPIESQKWTYFTVLMKSELDASSASLKLIKSFEVFLTKEVKQRLGLVDEEERGGSKPSADSQTKTARNQPELK